MRYDEGDRVVWSSAGGETFGVILARYEKKTTLTIAGHEITRHGNTDCPVYRIAGDDGLEALKLHSEIDRL